MCITDPDTQEPKQQLLEEAGRPRLLDTHKQPLTASDLSVVTSYQVGVTQFQSKIGGKKVKT